MSVLICKNVSSEGPGTIAEYLVRNGIRHSIVDLEKGDPLPDGAEFSALVIMGGPMSVNDDIAYLRDEERLILNFIEQGKGVLGVCLGAQLMARALGKKVYKGPAPEIGWMDIELSDAGLDDELLGGYARAGYSGRTVKVFQWHGETFDLPEGAVNLASSEIYANQAFRYGARAYALQFHIEVTRGMIRDWMANEDIDMAALDAETGQLYELYSTRGNIFYDRFFRPELLHRR